jgi:hypothetical protein
VKPTAPRLALSGALLALLLALACRVANVPQGPAALIFGATAVAGTAIYREATGGCWAACNTGWQCNPASGRCEPITHDPHPRLKRPPTPTQTSAPPTDAGPTDAGPTTNR